MQTGVYSIDDILPRHAKATVIPVYDELLVPYPYEFMFTVCWNERKFCWKGGGRIDGSASVSWNLSEQVLEIAILRLLRLRDSYMMQVCYIKRHLKSITVVQRTRTRGRVQFEGGVLARKALGGGQPCSTYLVACIAAGSHGPHVLPQGSAEARPGCYTRANREAGERNLPAPQVLPKWLLSSEVITGRGRRVLSIHT